MKTREERLAEKRIYYQENRDRIRFDAKAYRAAHRNAISLANRIWREGHKEYAYESNKKWIKLHPDRQQSNARAAACNRRAKAAGTPGKIRGDDVRDLWESQPVCLHCGEGRGVDHVIAFEDGGLNVPENLQNLCMTCNSRKRGKLNMDLAREMRRLYNEGVNSEELADQFGVSRSNAFLVVANKTWREPTKDKAA
jgi:5-methylcytosine-specific restriction endonuclease McrA